MNRVGEELAKTMPASFRHKDVWDTVTDAVKETGIVISKATATGRIRHSAFHKLWDVSVAMMELERIGPEADPGPLHALANRIGYCVKHIKKVQEQSK